MVKISFDVGGVISKYPHIFRPIINALLNAIDVKVFVLSDMYPHEKIMKMLHQNGFLLPPENVHCCDYAFHGESCKAEKMKELGIDLHIDDFPGYLAEGAAVRLLMMPDPREPYYHDDWITDGSEGNFGRRKKK